MTKHFRKEHPAESLNKGDDAEYTDIDESEEDVAQQFDQIPSEGSQGVFPQADGSRDTPPAPRRASTYSADLWCLPGQTNGVSKPKHLHSHLESRRDSAAELVKLERSLSRTPQRTFTDPYPTGPDNDYMRSVSGALPETIAIPHSMPQSATLDNCIPAFLTHHPGSAVWPPQLSMADSPTSMTSSSPGLDQSQGTYGMQGYQGQSMEMHSQHNMQRFPSQPQMLGLTAVHEIAMDEQLQSPFNTVQTPHEASRPPYAGIPSHHSPPSINHQQQQAYRHNEDTPRNKACTTPSSNDLPTTPIPNQALPYTSMADPPYQEPQALAPEPMGPYHPFAHYPPQNNFAIFNPLFKESKDDVYDRMPSHVMGGRWGEA